MKDLKIISEGINKKYGDSTPLTVSFVSADEYERPIDGINFTITLNSVTYHRTTDNDGNASLNINLPTGNYTASIVFNGDNVYNPNSKTVPVIVTEAGGNNITIKSKDLIKRYGDSTPLQVGLFSGSTPLANTPVQIKINGVTYNKVTEINGYTNLAINLPVGEYETEIRYNGSSTYMPQSKYVSVKILTNNISPAESKENPGNYFEVNGIGLIVKLSDGFSVTPGITIKETDMLMQTATLNAPTFYFNQGDHGTEFDISVMMRASYRYGDYTVMDYLDMWHKNLTPVSVVTDALDVPNSKYILSVKSKKQSNHNFSIWKLHFKQFYENNQSFERMYTEKQSTLSADDLELLKYQTINANSPKSAILALQRKLLSYGSFRPYNENNRKRVPDGVWDNDLMRMDIFMFQSNFMNTEKKQGICDKDTINSLINYDNYVGSGGWYDSSDLVWNGSRYYGGG